MLSSVSLHWFAIFLLEVSSAERAREQGRRLEVHHYVVALDRDLHSLGDVGSLHHRRARLDIDRIGFHAEAARVAIGLPGADVELPAVPWTANDLAKPGVFDLTGIAGAREPDQRAFAKCGALMRAAIEQAEELALDVEDRDRPVIDGDEFTRPRRQLIHRGNHMTRHQEIPYSFLALPR